MKTNDRKLELKIGAFVMVGVGLIMTAILILGGKSSLFSSVSHYTSHFPKIDGLISGAKVGMGGLQVGTVSSVSFDGKNRDIEVNFTVETKYAEFIRKDSTIEIVTQGVLGDKYLNLNAGDPSQAKIEDGGEITQGATKDISQLFTSSEKLMLQLTTTTESLDRILSAFNRGNRADKFFDGMAATSKNMGELSQRLNDQMADVKIKSAINHLNSILQKVDQGQGSVGAFINDPGLYDDAKALVGQVNRNRIMRNLIRQTIKDNKEKADEDDSEPAKPKK
jgi:phospholipid/cholesterol/gamma-HCH transport system substrate-binding protein